MYTEPKDDLKSTSKDTQWGPKKKDQRTQRKQHGTSGASRSLLEPLADQAALSRARLGAPRPAQSAPLNRWKFQTALLVSRQKTEKFENANDTMNNGLGIETRDGDSKHFGAPLFQRGEYALHELESLSHRHSDMSHASSKEDCPSLWTALVVARGSTARTSTSCARRASRNVRCCRTISSHFD